MIAPRLLLSLVGAVAGLVAGSFAATLVIRWPQGIGVVAGRSRCDGCGRRLRARDLVPLASYALALGRCRRCGGRIDPRHPAMELGCAILGAGALHVSPDPAGAAGALFGWWLLTLAVLDLEHLWLPDALTLSLGLAGLVAGMMGIAPPLAARAIGAVLGFVLLEAIRRAFRAIRAREGLGAGDPKLFAAIGAWLGWQALPAVLCGAAWLGIAWVLLRIAVRRPLARHAPMPMGTLLALAASADWLATATDAWPF